MFRQAFRKLIIPHNLGLLATLLVGGSILLLVWRHSLYYGEWGISTNSLYIWGTWPVHYAFAAPFSFRDLDKIFISHPLFYGERFLYPFAIDLLSGVLVRAGVDILFAHLVPAVLLSLMLLVSLYKFYEHFTKSARASFVSILLIIFSGGLGFIWLIENILAFGKTTLLSPTVYYTDMLDKGVYWFNIFVGELIPQRAFVLGMIVFLWVIVYLDKLSVKRFSTQIIPQIFLISLASSSLMLVHTHSLLTLMMVSAVYAFCRRQNVKFWLYYAFFTAVPSSLIYFFFYAGSVGTNYFHFLPGWLSNNSYNFFYFWMINWGIFFPLAIYAFVKGKSYLQPLVLSGAFLFVISNLVVFQPNSCVLVHFFDGAGIPVTKQNF